MAMVPLGSKPTPLIITSVPTLPLVELILIAVGGGRGGAGDGGVGDRAGGGAVIVNLAESRLYQSHLVNPQLLSLFQHY